MRCCLPGKGLATLRCSSRRFLLFPVLSMQSSDSERILTGPPQPHTFLHAECCPHLHSPQETRKIFLKNVINKIILHFLDCYNSQVWVSLNQDPGTPSQSPAQAVGTQYWALICCLPRCMSRELDQPPHMRCDVHLTPGRRPRELLSGSLLLPPCHTPGVDNVVQMCVWTRGAAAGARTPPGKSRSPVSAGDLSLPLRCTKRKRRQ